MIRIENLTFSYPKSETLFHELNLDLSPGNVYGLLGKNGAGKTTLLRVIAGLLFAQKGSCSVFEVSSASRTPAFLADMYFIAEELLLPPLKISEYKALYAPFYPSFSEELFQKSLREFSLSEKDRLGSLSFGQKKKFSIAFALASNTRLVIFDEPTNGLDIPSKSQFRKLLISCIDEERIFIISTHQVRDIQNLIDPIVILDEGRVILHESIDAINSRLGVKLLPGAPEPGDYLFVEKVIGGYAALCEDNTYSGNVDLELLFNATLENKERFAEIFHNNAVAES